MLAGRKDAVGLLLSASPILATLPWFYGVSSNTPEAFGVSLVASTAIGASMLAGGYIRSKMVVSDERARKGFVIPSDEVPAECNGPDGIRIGLTTDYHQPVDLTNGIQQRHIGIIGQSGVGKTTLIEYMLWQQTIRGGGWLFVDGKIDADTRDHVAYMAKAAGREDDLYILDVSNPENSNTMNPLLCGDPDEVASRLLNLVPSSENNPGADHYRQSANHALTVVIGALQASNKLYHFGDLSIILQSGRAMQAIEDICPEGKAKMALTIFLDQFRKVNKDGVTQIDTDRLKVVLGGMSGRIAMFAQGKFGDVFNVYAPEIVLEDIILQGKMLYVSLPTMGKDTAALNLGKMIISDLRSAVAVVQGLPKSKRPKIPFMAVLDEMGSYVMKGVSTLFEQARSAGITMVPAFQSFSQLTQVSPDFADIIIQNTWTKVCFKFGAVESSNMAAELLGSSIKHVKTITSSGSQGQGNSMLRTTPDGQESDSGGNTESWREEVDFRVSADQIRSLGMGEVVCISGADLYHLKTPMLEFPKTPPYEVMRYKTRMAKGKQPLNFEKQLSRFLVA